MTTDDPTSNQLAESVAGSEFFKDALGAIDGVADVLD